MSLWIVGLIVWMLSGVLLLLELFQLEEDSSGKK